METYMEYIHEYKKVKHSARLHIKCVYITKRQTTIVLQKLFHFTSECMCMVLNISEKSDFVKISKQGHKSKIGGSTLHLINSQNMMWTHEQNV